MIKLKFQQNNKIKIAKIVAYRKISFYNCQKFKSKVPMNPAIETEISIIGNKNRLSKAVGVSSVAVQKWREGGGLSVVHAVKSEDLTEGRVTARQISDGINPNQGAEK